uniref:Macaca fascicularis brain cDNA clone: QmoA-11393, similar to human KIAA1276 protein (KIAA1276), mRNA, RefSeq: XM_039169.4 n=1 Tax=Macaca fascicularis TaxID=9541 RepID=I7GE76_MACFA|nr:unnamed protein product [Macaca fascicularis]
MQVFHTNQQISKLAGWETKIVQVGLSGVPVRGTSPTSTAWFLDPCILALGYSTMEWSLKLGTVAYACNLITLGG